MSSVLKSLKRIPIFVLSLSIPIASAQAEVYQCEALEMSYPRTENGVPVTGEHSRITHSISAEIVIDTNANRFVLAEGAGRSGVSKIENYEPIQNDLGAGFSADLPDLNSKLLMRYRENDEFFALITGPLQIMGTCP